MSRLQRLPPLFRTETEVKGTVALVSFFGDLDLRSFEECERTLHALEVRIRHLILDLRGLSLVDATGLRMVLRAHMRAEVGTWRLTVVGGVRVIEELLAVHGLLDFHSIRRKIDWAETADGLFPPRPAAHQTA